MRIPDAPLTDAELEELDTILHRDGAERMYADHLDGFFAALVCSPVIAMPGEWLPVVWGPSPPEWKSVQEAQKVTDLLMRHWNHVAGTINDGTFSPLTSTGVNADGREITIAHTWCMGFHEGMRLHAGHWFDESAVELQELLFPVKALLADMWAVLRNSGKKRKKKPLLTDEQRDDLADDIADAVIALRAYWLKHPVAAGTSDTMPRAPAPAASVPREEGTWIAGLTEFPAFIDGEGPPYRPVVALVLDAGGLICGMSLGHPENRGTVMADAVEQALNEPAVGAPGRPHRVVVPARELKPLLAEVLPGIPVVVGPTPELDKAIASLRDRAQAPGEHYETTSYLSADATPEVVASFFDAAAELYERAPWTVVPDDECLFRITSAKLGLRKAAACIIGQMGENYGVILFESLDDFARFQRLSERAAAGDAPRSGFPRHAAVNFERARDLPAPLRKEIKARKWRVAGPAAFPWIMLVEPDMVLRPATRDDYRRMEGVCRAISRLIATETGLPHAWEGARSLRRRLTVEVQGAPVSVSISVR